eukprot:scaffold6843_cov66-Phaeocystis_antarctica.AAC.3
MPIRSTSSKPSEMSSEMSKKSPLLFEMAKGDSDDHAGTTTTAAHDIHEQSPPTKPESWWSPSPCELAKERLPADVAREGEEYVPVHSWLPDWVTALAAGEPLPCMGAHWFGALAGSAESRNTARDGGAVTWSTPPAHLLRAQLSSPALAASMREMSIHSSQSVEEAATA